MATSQCVEDGAKSLVRSFSKPGDILRKPDLLKVSLPGQIADFETYLNYALEQGWVELKGTDYCLTDTGFKVAQSTT
jgi:hypothetical protein